MKLKSIAMILVAVAGVLASSCIREDYSDCFNRYVVNLSYMGDGTDEIFPQKIRKVQMYIFDSENRCIHQATLPDEELRLQRTMLPVLEQGDYRLVFLGNMNSTEVTGLQSGDFSEILFGDQAYWDGGTVSGNDSLYLAGLDYTIEPFSSERKITTKTAAFASSHYDVIVEVIGVPKSAMTSAPMIVLTGVSPYADFNNVAATDHQTDYVLDPVHDGNNKATATCNILRHLDHENVYLKVLDADGGVMASVNFAEFIQKHADHIDCSKHEVVIPIKVEFNASQTDVKVTLPDWWVVDVHPGWI